MIFTELAHAARCASACADIRRPGVRGPLNSDANGASSRTESDHTINWFNVEIFMQIFIWCISVNKDRGDYE